MPGAWGTELAEQLVKAPPGVPVARLLAAGTVDVGFQQLSELLDEADIDIVGAVPAAVVPLTDFAVGRTMAAQASAADGLISYLTSAQAHAPLERHGLQPA